MPESSAAESFAVQRRRESRREEWAEQTKLAGMLAKYLDPACTFWTSLENKPLSRLPQAPDVAARRRAAQRRWLARHRVRNATQYATARPRARNNELRRAPRRTRTTTTNRLTPFSATYRNKTPSFRGPE
jgi:hypothetical protein